MGAKFDKPKWYFFATPDMNNFSDLYFVPFLVLPTYVNLRQDLTYNVLKSFRLLQRRRMIFASTWKLAMK